MNPLLQEKLRELLQKHPVPRIDNKIEFEYGQFAQMCPPTYGIVVDNRDPECLGRVRLELPLVSPGRPTPWYQIATQYRRNKCGWWALPDIGTQVIVCFPTKNYSQGIVLGCIYDQKHRPPEHSTDNPSKSMLLQTKKHRIEIIDEDGKEEIRFESAEGKMRAILGPKGIELINELDGGIEVNCKKLNIKGKNVNIVSKKDTTITTDGNAKFTEKGKLLIQSDKDVTLKGKNVKLSGTNGVTAQGKQIATQDSKVMGFDTHIMVIPAGTSTANVPLPHPFIGKMGEKCSSDVKIKGKGVAVKGSKCKHNDSMHLQLPGTIKFQNNPKKEGEVTGGTVSKVKVDGKEVAVIGSQVTTCNDIGMQNNSTIIAPGASIPMPVIINPKNTEEFERKMEEAEKREPKFSSVKWGCTSIEAGEEVELSASVQDIADGNMVTLLVFPEGKGPEDGTSLANLPLTVKNGSVSAKWRYRANQSEMPPDNDPKFTFTAHSAWCNFEKSSNSVEVKLVRPEVKKVEWQDKDGSSTSKGLVGEVLKMHAETKDMEGGVTFHIFDEYKREVYSVGADIKGDAADAEWTYHWNGIKLDHKPKFTVKVTGDRCKTVESSECEVSQKFTIEICKFYDDSNNDDKFYLLYPNDKEEELKTDNGAVEKEDLIPGKYSVIVRKK